MSTTINNVVKMDKMYEITVFQIRTKAAQKYGLRRNKTPALNLEKLFETQRGGEVRQTSAFLLS